LYNGETDKLEVNEYQGIEKKYHCGKEFYRPDVSSEEPYILLTFDNREATIGIIYQKIKVIYSEESQVPGKEKAGGQSAKRYERIREVEKIKWCKKVSQKMLELSIEKPDYKILLGGPGPAKEKLINYLNNEVLKKVIATKDIGYTSLQGLNELFKASQDDLKNSNLAEIERKVTEFAGMLGKGSKLVDYGIISDWSNVKTLFVAEEIEEIKIKKEKHGFEVVVSNNPIITALNLGYVKRYVSY